VYLAFDMLGAAKQGAAVLEARVDLTKRASAELREKLQWSPDSRET
jgi:hypothetical protein